MSSRQRAGPVTPAAARHHDTARLAAASHSLGFVRKPAARLDRCVAAALRCVPSPSARRAAPHQSWRSGLLAARTSPYAPLRCSPRLALEPLSTVFGQSLVVEAIDPTRSSCLAVAAVLDPRTTTSTPRSGAGRALLSRRSRLFWDRFLLRRRAIIRVGQRAVLFVVIAA